MDPKKIKAIINWQELKNIKDIKAFIKFNNFYWRFINNFSTLVLPLIVLTWKDKAFIFNKKYKKAFIFNKEYKKAFAYLKVIFTTIPIL